MSSADHPDRPDVDLHAGPLLALTATELEVLEQAHLSDLDKEDRGTPDDPTREDDTGVIGSGIPGNGPGNWASRIQEARASLLARGLLSLQGAVRTDSASGLLAQAVLDVRLGAEAMIVVERMLGEPEARRDLRLLHLVPLGGVIEDVHPEGLHGLDLVLDPADLVEAVTAMLVPPDARPGNGSDRDVDPSRLDRLGATLDGPTVLAELTLTSPAAPDRAEGWLVALGPRGCHVAEREPDPAALRFRPVDPSWVQEQVTTWVSPVVQPAGQQESPGPDGGAEPGTGSTAEGGTMKT